MTVRRATVVDLPLMLDIARASYGVQFDEDKAREFGLRTLMSPEIAAFLDDDAFCMVGLSEYFWERQKRANCMFTAVRKAQVWQAVKTVRAALQWSRSKGASSFHIGEETGMDMGVIAKRLGLAKDRPSYRIDLRSPQHRFWMRAA